MNIVKRKRNQAWTLTELLLVLAIIAVLAALLYVCLAPMRGRGSEARCMNNLRQIGVALSMYRQDHDGIDLPQAQSAAAYGLPQRNLLSLLPYLKDRNVLKCNDEAFPFSPDTKVTVSYQSDLAYLGDKPYRPEIPTFIETAVKRGDSLPFVFDPHHGEQFRNGQAELFRVLVLRLNGRVEALLVRRVAPVWEW